MNFKPSSCRLTRVFLGLALGLISALSAGQSAESRTALVIGNARYEAGVGALRNTDNDAKAVAKTLRSLGFSVMERHDVTRDQLIRAVAEFRKTLPGSEVAILYYAGHGISVAGSNYLIPLKSGFDPEGADEVTLRMLAETRLFNAEQAVADMSAAGARCNLVILDACRNTPLARTARTRSAAGKAGLTEMTPPAGSLIAFATDAGRTAYDGDGTNGLYTEELLKNMRTPGLTIEQVFKRTRAGVLTRSEGGQVPAEYSRLIGDDIYLAGQSAPAAVIPVKKHEELPTATELTKLATNGKVDECLKGLQRVAEAKGPGDFAVKPLESLLEGVKNDLKEATAPSPKVIAAEETCAAILRVLPECLPLDHPQAKLIAARVYNRRGDALLILGRAEDAAQAFDSALPLAPDDAYVLYNRGRANLALGNKDQARADFTNASSPRFNQPKARKLALDELQRME